MRAVDVIRAKRDGGELSPAQIDAFVRAAVDGTWPDYQLAALLMAVWLRGMTPAETAVHAGIAGPLYNQVSCEGCHAHNNRGVPPAAGNGTRRIAALLPADRGA